MAGLKEFEALVAQDAALAAEVKKCKNYDELIELAEAKGFFFTNEEIEALTDIMTEELSRVAGGVTLDSVSIDSKASVHVLVTAGNLF